MKTYKQMADSVFARSQEIINKRAIEHKKRSRILIPTVVLLVSAIGILVAGTASRQKFPYSSVASKTDEENRTESKGRDKTGSLETESENASSVTKPSVNPFMFAGEDIADMHRPEGYHYNISSSLALMMYWNPEPETRFSVFLYGLSSVDVLETVSKINETISDKIIMSEENRLNVVLDPDYEDDIDVDALFVLDCYHVYLTADQINQLAENNIRCSYLRSGGTNYEYEDMNWDTKEGIRAFCENNRDCFILSGENLVFWAPIA